MEIHYSRGCKSNKLWYLLGGDCVDFTEIVNLIVNNSVAVGVVVYFLYTNYKFNKELVETLTKINEKLERGAKYE